MLAIAAALAAPVLAPYDPARQHYDRILAEPGPEHPLGTDQLGRDVLSRLLWGARVSLAVGILTQVIVVGVGVAVGAAAGVAGGRVDNLLMRLTDVVYALPELLLAILLRAVVGSSPVMLIVAIGLASWVGVARLTRGQMLTLKERDFVRAARAMGAGPIWITRRHLLPNAAGPLIILLTFNVPRAVFAEAALSYIGIGIAPPTPSWGSMIQEGAQAIFAAPTLVLFPSLAIVGTMLAFTLLGDGLRDQLDPRASG